MKNLAILVFIVFINTVEAQTQVNPFRLAEEVVEDRRGRVLTVYKDTVSRKLFFFEEKAEQQLNQGFSLGDTCNLVYRKIKNKKKIFYQIPKAYRNYYFYIVSSVRKPE